MINNSIMDSARSSRSSSPAEEKHILQAWKPEPLIPKVDLEDNQHVLRPRIVTSKAGKYITIDGIKCLNLSTNNYLGLADDKRLEAASKEAVKKYGVGSCGPRAFYGTMDVHLELEEELAKFLQVQEAVLYSFAFSTIASAIPAYAKSSDIIFVDEYCNFAIQQGLKASKSKIIKFNHNNIKHLETLVEENKQEQLKKFGRPNKIRTFLIVEGIYYKTGDLCPLKELIEIKKKYKIRLFIDESRSFGVLGSGGKGVSQHFDVDINDIDIIMASLDNALCSYGGFCAGSTYIIDHQRLAGSGYCFSASLPPFQTRVALEALSIIKQDPTIVQNSQELYKYAHDVLKNLTKLENISNALSPIKLLTIKKSTFTKANNNNNDIHNSDNQQTTSYCKQDEKFLNDICNRVLMEENIAICVSRYMEDQEMTNPIASIRLVINGCLVRDEIDRVCATLERYSTSIRTNRNNIT